MMEFSLMTFQVFREYILLIPGKGLKYLNKLKYPVYKTVKAFSFLIQKQVYDLWIIFGFSSGIVVFFLMRTKMEKEICTTKFMQIHADFILKKCSSGFLL
jgi:hypothetical protein